MILFIFDLSINKGGLDFKILSLAFSEISVVKSNNVTGTFALHNWAAIPLPIVPDPMTTTLLIFIMRIETYNEYLIQEQLKAIKYF